MGQTPVEMWPAGVWPTPQPLPSTQYNAGVSCCWAINKSPVSAFLRPGGHSFRLPVGCLAQLLGKISDEQCSKASCLTIWHSQPSILLLRMLITVEALSIPCFRLRYYYIPNSHIFTRLSHWENC